MILVAMRAVNSSPPIEKLDIFLINRNVLEINNLITWSSIYWYRNYIYNEI